MFLGIALCLLAAYALSPFSGEAVGTMPASQRLFSAALLAGVGLKLILDARRRARQVPSPTPTPANAPEPPAPAPPPDRAAGVGRTGIAIAICLLVWFVPPWWMQLANGVDHSDQAFGRVLVVFLVSLPLGVFLAKVFLDSTGPRKR